MSPQMNTLGIDRKWSCQSLCHGTLAPCSGPNCSSAGFWLYITQIWVMLCLWGKIENCNSLASTPEWQLLEFWVCLWIGWRLLDREFSNFISHMVRSLSQSYSSLVKIHLFFHIVLWFYMWIFSPCICILYVLAENNAMPFQTLYFATLNKFSSLFSISIVLSSRSGTN